MDEKQLVSVDTNDLVVVKQLPVIEDRLDEAFIAVRGRLSAMANLVVTEDNYKELKKVRADLNKEYGELDALRKKVKEAVEAPYKKFEAGAYKRLADEYKLSISQLDGEIKEVEIGLKAQRQEELLKYFDEYRQSLGLDSAIADPKKSGIKVGLSGTMKALKEQAKKYLDGVDGDLKMIDTLDDRDEVLAEYRILGSVTDAVRVVAERHKRIEEMRALRESEEKRQVEERVAAVTAVVDEKAPQGDEKGPNSNDQPEGGAVAPPEVRPAVEENEVASEQIYSTKYLGFEILGTITQLKALKAFLKDQLVKYLEKEGLEYGEC